MSCNLMFSEYLKKARLNGNVWIADVREEFNSSSQIPFEVKLKLTLLDNNEREFRLHLPDYSDEGEKKLLTDYISASLYNILAAVGGRRYEFIYDEENDKLNSLIFEVNNRFKPEIRGYGKIIRENQRISSHISFDGKTVEKRNLPEYLRKTVSDAQKGVRAGIDVGGTDIKLAVSKDGILAGTLEYDWNPSVFKTGDEFVRPVIELAKKLLGMAGAEKFDGIGLSFPDVCIFDKICGGETPKTLGIHNNSDVDYEREFKKISDLGAALKELCIENGEIHIVNDGSVAAFAAGVELAFKGDDELISDGVFSYALGTSFGSGWIDENGDVPPIPQEFYDSIIDIGSYESGLFAARDLRSTVSEASGFQGVDRYVGQAAAFRYAYDINPSLLDGFIEENNGMLKIISEPSDMRKLCLEHLMRLAKSGNEDAKAVFLKIGECLGQVSREVEYLLQPESDMRYIFGRFAKYPEIFSLLKEGHKKTMPKLELIAADDGLAFSPLMVQLAKKRDITVAQFGQAIGAIYLSAKK